MLNLSLSGCGFLGIYHIGVISAFREHAPEFLQGKMTGASAGALVAACALCDCCLGQMVGDTIEIALKARSHALGPLHPSFSIVDILRNGLRRILPIDAHKICSGRLLISLTRWKDGQNVLVSEFDSREDLIQALICSSFVPMYSGFFPPKFRGAYYWDGGLSNNNPVLDENTIKVSPFGGESDICPRDESGSFYCMEFQGTNIQWSNENIYRLGIALFPPNPEILKAICFRGYKDAITFLRARNLLHCSCLRYVREKTSISSVVGEDLHDLNEHIEQNRAAYEAYEDVSDVEEDFDEESNEEKIIQYAHNNDSLQYQEMSNTVCEVLDAACQDDKNLLNHIFNSQIMRAISIALLPWTLPLEMSLNFTRKIIELIPKIQVSPDSKNIRDHLLIYFNLLIEKLTHDKYQYHTRVTCKLCVMSSNTNPKLSPKHSGVCKHSPRHSRHDIFNHSEAELPELNSKNLVKLKRELYFPKFCARHRRPTEGSEASHLSERSSTGVKSRRLSPSGRSQFSSHSGLGKYERRSLNYLSKMKA